MKKLIWLILLSGFLISKTYSQKCSIDEAENIAINTINEKINPISKNAQSFEIKNIEVVYFNENEVFYLVNLRPQGFILISSEKSVEPVLAFSLESDYELENNPSAKFWINNYAKQIEYSIQHVTKATLNVDKEWQRLSRDPKDFIPKSNIKTVEPLLFTKWSQGKY